MRTSVITLILCITMLMTAGCSTSPTNNGAFIGTASTTKFQLKADDSISMNTPSIGWDFTIHPGAVMQNNALLRTTTGWYTWKSVTPSVTDLKNDVFIGGLAIDENTAWVISSSRSNKQTNVYHTSNGGETWRKGTIPGVYSLSWISFIDSKHGWILASTGPITGEEPCDLYYTSTGGEYWTKLGTTGGMSSIPMDDGKTGITFINQNTGWITIDSGQSPGEVGLFVTHDCGKSWIKKSVTVPSALKNSYPHPKPPIFCSSQDGVLPVIFPGHGTVLYFTIDSGKTWVPSKTIPITSFNINISVMKLSNVWVSDGDAVYASHNYGATWNDAQNVLPHGAVIKSIFGGGAMSATAYILNNNGIITRYKLVDRHSVISLTRDEEGASPSSSH